MPSTDPEALAYKAMRVLDDFFTHPAKAKDPDLRAAARMAASYLSTWATLQQADNNRELIKVRLAELKANDDNGKFRKALKEG